MRTIAKIIRQIAGLFQTDATSADLHDEQFLDANKYAKELVLRGIFQRENHFNCPETRFADLLACHPVFLAVDIGCGTGWATEELANVVDSVIAIDPSSRAMTMARRIVKDKRIVWRHGLAQDVIPTLYLPIPTVFISAAVLSHLPDKSVIRICNAIDAVAVKGSTLGFSECWGDTYHEWMWHVRTIEWWQNRFPNWTLDFFGPWIEGKTTRHKGFHGFKL